MFTGIKGVIFDLDGTLIDSVETWNDIAGAYMKSIGIDPGPDLRDAVRDMSLEEGCVYCIERYGLDSEVGEMVDDVNAMMERFYQETFPLKPGALELVRALAEEGIKMSVATLTDIHLAEACLKRLGILEYMEDVVTCRMAGAQKDKPDVYLMSSERMGLSPEEVLVIEDSLGALRTAKAAGYKTAAVSEPEQAHAEEEIRKTADRYIVSFTDVVVRS